MPLDPHGSRPEVFETGNLTFDQQNFKANEIEHLPGHANNWRPKRKCGLPDAKKAQKAFLDGWDRIWGSKE